MQEYVIKAAEPHGLPPSLTLLPQHLATLGKPLFLILMCKFFSPSKTFPRCLPGTPPQGTGGTWWASGTWATTRLSSLLQGPAATPSPPSS